MAVNIQSAKGAIATLAAFPGQINSARTAAGAVTLGPWNLDVRCDYGYLNGTERHFWWNVDFAGSRAYLQNALQSVGSHAYQFNNAFAPVHDWHRRTVPQVANALGDAKTYIQQNSSGLKRENWQGPLHQALLIKLNNILSLLQSSSIQLNQGMQAVLNFLSAQQSLQAYVNVAVNNLENDAAGVLQRMKPFIDGQPCGSGAAYGQYNAFKLQYTNAQNSFAQTFGTLTQQSSNANNAINLLVGMVMNFINDYKPVQQKLQAAERDSRYVFELLDIDVAAGQWGELAAYAKGIGY